MNKTPKLVRYEGRTAFFGKLVGIECGQEKEGKGGGEGGGGVLWFWRVSSCIVGCQLCVYRNCRAWISWVLNVNDVIPCRSTPARISRRSLLVVTATSKTPELAAVESKRFPFFPKEEEFRFFSDSVICSRFPSLWTGILYFSLSKKMHREREREKWEDCLVNPFLAKPLIKTRQWQKCHFGLSCCISVRRHASPNTGHAVTLSILGMSLCLVSCCHRL